MKSCTTVLGFIKSVQDGFQNNSQCCIKKRRTRLDICQKHLDHYGNEGGGFLHRIITANEAWIHQYKPESKR